MKRPTCNLCRSHAVTPLDIGEPTAKVGHNVICETCGLIFHYPAMSAEEMKKLYIDDYSSEYSASETIGRDMARSRIAFLQQQIDLVRVETALEIGCARGEFLSELNRAGIPAEGVEPSQAMAGLGRNTYGVKITGGVYDDFPVHPEYYDLISMFHVLEHVPNPLATLQRIKKELKPDGRLFLEVPTIADCQLSIVFKTIHPTTFVAATLNAMLVEAGFDVLHIAENGYHLRIFAKPASRLTAPIRPVADVIKARVHTYLTERRRVIEGILNKMQCLIHKGTGAIYGAGLNTLDLDQVFPLKQLKLDAIFDRDTRKHGNTILGLPIQDPATLQDWNGDYIIISSYAFQAEIMRQLEFLKARGIDLITLYELNDHD
jgi:2-polyprenyl-3-methyl-5-hydroxy-6-metoxy-1,4-benzoquinol methylase